MSTAREGSILSGGAPPVRSAATPTIAPKPAPVKTEKLKPIPDDMPLGEVPGSERILSVTERKVGTDEVVSDAPAEGVSTLPEPPKMLSSKGWTARRPDAGSLR